MPNPLSVQDIQALTPDTLLTIAPGRGPLNRQPFVCRVSEVHNQQTLVLYVTTKTRPKIRLFAVAPSPRCRGFHITGRPGEWEITAGYDKTILDRSV